VFDRRVEVVALRKSGAEFAIEAAISVARHGGEPIFTAVLHDITQRKQDHEQLLRQTKYLERAVAALERVRERERQVLAAIPSVFIGLDDDGIVSHWNPAAEKQFGLAVEHAIGKPLGDLAVGWPAERIHQAIAHCSRANEAVRFDELHVSDSQGRERILALTINRTEARDNQDCGVVLVGTDVTDRKAMEVQLMLAQKMESIGQLAAGIAHEINTPTQYVSDNARFLRDAFGDLQQLVERYERLRAEAAPGTVPAPAIEELNRFIADIDLGFLTAEIPKAIEQSMEGLHRVAEIVRAMKQFSHPDQDEPELADLNKAIGNTVTVARNEWKYVAEMELDLEAELPAVPCLVGRFNQVILNLIVNAAQAIADVVGDGSHQKGKIRITTRQARDHVEIRVADTGGGIPAKIRNRIFDPFFTTKQVGKGTGQGLAIAHNIVVEQHGGAIEVESEEGQGATFILRLPLKASQPPAEGQA
jgi:PAS domain S-box-containing protein